MYSLIENERDKNYNPKYNPNIAIETQNITNQSLAIVMLLHLNYWCNMPQEKQQLKQILEKNNIEIQEKYDIENIFKERIMKNNLLMEEIQENTKQKKELIEYKETIIQKLRKFVYNIFHKNKI